MKILVLPSWYKKKNNSIMGSFFREQALMLKRKGNDVAVLFLELHNLTDRIESHIEISRDEGILTITYHAKSFGYAKITSIYNNVIKYYYGILFNKLLSNGFIPDIIQAHSFIPGGIAACYLGKKFEIPVVFTEHRSTVHDNKLTHTQRSSLYHVVNNSQAVVSVSHSLGEVINKLCGRSDIEIIPNNVSPIFKYTYSKTKSPFSFACVGNLIDSKRQDLLIECFSDAFDKSNEILYIVGSGARMQYLEDLAHKLKLDNRVIFTGTLSREKVSELLNEINVFVLISKSETFGVSYIEALACGCPIIATDNGGSKEIVNIDNGIIVPVDDKTSIIKALKQMRKRYLSYNLESISNSCLQRFSEDAVYRKQINVYKRILEDTQKNVKKAL